MCDPRDAESRKQFFLETGKTPEQEKHDSGVAIGRTLIVLSLSVLVGLIAYLW